ncbi:MAG: aldolase [Clostridia bacterium]|nr:aldolase [Clostridia bacterium]
MALKLMYITNRPEIARIIEAAGVDRIFVDMEYIGKSIRQSGMDTVQSHHTIEDIKRIKASVTKAQVMVRVNPIHEASESYPSSKEEIDAAIAAGADILMLPYFKTAAEVQKCVDYVGGRVKNLPLVETPEAAEHIDEIIAVDGIDEIYVGLNDLSLGYGKKFMFELLADGTVDALADKFKQKGLPFGFGGIAAVGQGMLPGERVIAEHYRLGSTCAILSRSFCNTDKVTDLEEVRQIFETGLADIRAFEEKCAAGKIDYAQNCAEVRKIVPQISERIKNR